MRLLVTLAALQACNRGGSTPDVSETETDADADSDADTDTDSDTDSDTDTDPPTGQLVLPAGASFVEAGWTVTRRIRAPGPLRAVAWTEGAVYFGIDDSPTATGGIYEAIGADARLKREVVDRLDRFAVDDQGRFFWSEDLAHRLRSAGPGRGQVDWVTGWGPSGDEAPGALAVARVGRTGGLLPGQGVFVDRGIGNGQDGLWRFDAEVAEGEVELAGDGSLLLDPVAVTLTGSAIWVADVLHPQALLRFDGVDDFELVALPAGFSEVQALDLDPRSGELWIGGPLSDGLARVDTLGTTLTPVVAGLPVSTLAADRAGLRLAVGVGDELFVLARCAVSESADCDGNGVADVCDLERELAGDCDQDGMLDVCTADDCDADGVFDMCADCGPVDVVVLLDETVGQEEEGDALCAELPGVLGEQRRAGVDLEVTVLGLDDPTRFACVQDSVPARYGTSWPVAPDPNLGVDYLDCGSGDPAESWGGAVALTAANHPWRAGARRLIVVLTDAPASCGGPFSIPDIFMTAWALSIAQDHGVVVSSLAAPEATPVVIGELSELANGTGGVSVPMSVPALELAWDLAILLDVECTPFWDCDGSGVADACQLLDGADDCDGNGRLDTCDVEAGEDPGTCPPS